MASKSSRLLLPALVCAWVLAWTLPLAAQNGEQAPVAAPEQPAKVEPPSPYPAELAQRVTRLADDVENAAKAVARVKDRESGLAEQRRELERIEVEAQQVIEKLKPRLDAVSAQLLELGPPPAKDAAPEASAVASERTRLTGFQAEIAGAIKTAELARVRSRQLIGHVQDLRQAIFARELLLRSGSPLESSTWQELARELPRAARQIKFVVLDWWYLVQPRQFLLVLTIAGAALAYAATIWVIFRLRRRMQSSSPCSPDYFGRASDAFWSAASRAVPPLAAAMMLYGGLAGFGLLTLTTGEFARSALLMLAIYTGASAFATAVLAPSCPPNLPLVDIADSSAPKLLRLANAFAGLLALDLLLSDVVRMLYLPLEIGVVQTSITSLGFAALLVAFVRTPIARREIALLELPPRSRPRWLKLPLAVIAASIIATTLVGYVALGRFISTQLTLVGTAALVMYLAHLAIRRFAAVMTEGGRPVGRVLEASLGLDQERSSYVTKLAVGLAELVLFLTALPLLLLTWGYSRDDIVDWLKLGIFGFEIGQFRISLVRILMAAVLFLGLLFGTRLVQRWLDRSVLEPARVDRAISHSVRMGVGYTGVALATILALSYAGLDFTQLAIVAGALSVGIGFGLQAIFNNFVSGIILLVERPIKVGDWIVVNGQEGFVRRINVRATEIETFDRASLIIPNSVLITGSVMNWTHRNQIGRVTILVSVSYSADPEQVLNILNRIAEESPSLLKQPAPNVAFEDFGPHALHFALRGFVPDVGNRGTVQTELRIAIFKAFREVGIEIPYPQHDVHLRDLDGVRHAFMRALEARRREQEVEASAN